MLLLEYRECSDLENNTRNEQKYSSSVILYFFDSFMAEWKYIVCLINLLSVPVPLLYSIFLSLTFFLHGIDQHLGFIVVRFIFQQPTAGLPTSPDHILKLHKNESSFEGEQKSHSLPRLSLRGKKGTVPFPCLAISNMVTWRVKAQRCQLY